MIIFNKKRFARFVMNPDVHINEDELVEHENININNDFIDDDWID